MAPTAGFGRDDIPAPPSFDHDGADTSPNTPVFYQMVPVGSQRVWGVRISGGRVAIASMDTSVAGLMSAQLPLGGPFPNDLPLVFVDFRTTIHKFRIIGKKAGSTLIIAFDEQFKELARLIVSVKAEKTVTYNLLRLRDVFREPARDEKSLARIMTNVEKIYLNQTNTRLIRQRSQELFVKADLKDALSLEPSRPGKPNAPIAIRDRIAELKLDDVDRNVVSTWNIDDEPTRGFTLANGPVCLAEKQDDEVLETIAIAHELGHSFKLQHLFHVTPDILMHDGPNGCKMHGFDIDRINPSGT